MTAGRPPPRYVPTLTEVVQPPAATGTAAEPAVALALAQEEAVRRVLQRVDTVLERRLRERIAAVAAAQTQALVPLLQEEIEACVRDVVAQAFEQEFGRPPSGA